MQHVILPALAFVASVVVFESTQIDLAFTRLFWDESAHHWTWGKSWWTNEFLHSGGAIFILSIGAVVLLVLAGSFVRDDWRPWRRAALFVALCMATGPGIVAIGKDTTNVDCPRQLKIYWASKPYTRLFEDKPDDLPRSRCFPAGHSSGAFSLVAFYFVLRERSRRHARAALGGAIGLGFLWAFGQWTRGAHYPSHDIWSLAICWFVAVGYYTRLFHCRLWPDDVPDPGGGVPGAA